MMRHLTFFVIWSFVLTSLGPTMSRGVAEAKEVEEDTRGARGSKSRRKARSRKGKHKKRRRRSRVFRPKKARLTNKRPARRTKTSTRESQVNPYFLVRKSDYPGQVKGYLPGGKKKTRIQFTARQGVAYFEGDIVLGPSKGIGKRLSKKGTGARGAVQNNIDFIWPNGVIPYLIDESMMRYKKTLGDIQAAIAELNQKTNLKIVPWSDEDNYVKVVVAEGCSSWVGMQGGMQELNIAPKMKNRDAYCTKTAIIHELLHAAGFWHTQSRSDRENYVRIYQDNISVNHLHNFNRHSDLSYGDWLDGYGAKAMGTYEATSIMHYGSGFFAEDYWGCVGDHGRGGDLSLCTLLTKDGKFIRPSKTLTGNDITLVNTLYPKNTHKNKAIDTLRRACRLAVRKYCRTADDVVNCLAEAKRKKAREYPGVAFGDGTACRSQLKKVQEHDLGHPPQGASPGKASKAKPAELKRLKRYCRRAIRKYCRRAKDTVSCLRTAQKTKARTHPNRSFGDSNRCRAQLKKMSP